MDKDIAAWLSGFRSAIPGQYVEWHSGSGTVEHSRGVSAYYALLEEAVGKTVNRLHSTQGNAAERLSMLEDRITMLEKVLLRLEADNQALRDEITRKDNRWGSF